MMNGGAGPSKSILRFWFFGDRWDCVSAYLDDLGEAEVTHDTRPGQFVKEALLDWWDQRYTENCILK